MVTASNLQPPGTRVVKSSQSFRELKESWPMRGPASLIAGAANRDRSFKFEHFFHVLMLDYLLTTTRHLFEGQEEKTGSRALKQRT